MYAGTGKKQSAQQRNGRKTLFIYQFLSESCYILTTGQYGNEVSVISLFKNAIKLHSMGD